jgi:hypothetical protein
MLVFSAAALGTRATSRSTADGYITEWTRTSAPAASFSRFLDGAVSPEITIERIAAALVIREAVAAGPMAQ